MGSSRSSNIGAQLIVKPDKLTPTLFTLYVPPQTSSIGRRKRHFCYLKRFSCYRRLARSFGQRFPGLSPIFARPVFDS